MRNTHESSNKNAAQPPATEQQSVHAEFMASAVPAWLVNASPERREAVKNAALVLPDWYQAASPAQRQALNASFVASVTSQTLLDKTMSRLQDIDAFAQPLLVKALKDQFAVELDVTKTFLQLKKPLEMGILDIEVGTFEVLKLPLLQAALHNFEAQECAPAYYHSSSGFVVESTPGQFSEVPTALTVMQYLMLCRELARLEREYETLNQQLSAWAFSGGGARSRYVRAGQMSAGLSERAERYTAADRIRECWRRQSPQRNAVDGSPIGFELDLSGQTLDSVPDLEADFSHVGSLKLNNMGLSVSPEGFLAHFKGVRWLDLSNNQLTAIPPALDDMHGLTRLFLQRNRIRLTSETAAILSRRTTLRAMNLGRNPLGMAPDFTQITDMRSLNLNSIDIETWPVGLGGQPLLDVIDLRNNRITTIPEAVIAPPAERLEQVAGLNNFTLIGDNPLSEVTQQQLRDYWSRLERERPDLWGVRRPGVFEYRAPTGHAIVGGQEMAGLQRWLKDLPADQVPARQTQWQSLSTQEGSQGFFSVLSKLENAGAGHADLQLRVWEVVDTITEVNPESLALRQEMFEWAGRPACCDRAALSFSNLEIMALVYRARTLAMDGEQSAGLLKLSRGLFRLDELEKIALADIEQRTTAINNTPGLSAGLKAQQIRLLEEVEIKLAYRYGLKDRLGLPGQPRQVRFVHMGKVTPAMLDQACAKVLALDGSPEEFQSLVAKDFWKDFITNKYRVQFEAQREPYQDRLASLRDRQQAGELSEARFKVQSADLDAQLQIEEAALIEKFTREELIKHPL